MLSNLELKCETAVKFLGVIIDENSSWIWHIDISFKMKYLKAYAYCTVPLFYLRGNVFFYL